VTERLQYSKVVHCSEEDQAYLVTRPGWEGLAFNPVTHGETYEQAVAHGHEALAAHPCRLTVKLRVRCHAGHEKAPRTEIRGALLTWSF
jgi:predicted RNase H-like HicB family nuclease